MKRKVIFLFVIFIISSCTHRIVRKGYNINKSDFRSCDVVIKKHKYISDSIARKIGEIIIGEGPFTVACSESHAVNILKAEACAINADLIVITHEDRPDFRSGCYTCRAVFYKCYSSTTIQSDDIYRSERIRERVTKDRIKVTAIILGSVFVCSIIAFYLFP